MKRGVRCRGLYERAILEAPEIKTYLSKWIVAGEEMRVHEGELPHKLAIFDQQDILIPLEAPGGNGRNLHIRHPQLASSLGMLFDFLWERARPLAPGSLHTTLRAGIFTRLRSQVSPCRLRR